VGRCLSPRPSRSNTSLPPPQFFQFRSAAVIYLGGPRLSPGPSLRFFISWDCICDTNTCLAGKVPLAPVFDFLFNLACLRFFLLRRHLAFDLGLFGEATPRYKRLFCGPGTPCCFSPIFVSFRAMIYFLSGYPVS